MHNGEIPRIDSFGELYEKYNVKSEDSIILSINRDEIGKLYVEFERAEMIECVENDEKNDGIKFCLEKKQLVRIMEAIIELKQYINAKRVENESAYEYIQNPKIPSMLSESLVVHLIEDKKILEDAKISRCRLGGGADIIGKTGRKKIKIEVKATTAGFQQLTKKDVKANYLIWVDLEKTFNSEIVNDSINDNFEVYVIVPQKHEIKEGKITLKQFKEKIKRKNPDYQDNIINYLKG